ncbi:BrnT family toxin [Candidatus Roizmanbacteria bacterium]|nr:BrnT family toxin [Candidatus Roizmanbacteria bacterium]
MRLPKPLSFQWDKGNIDKNFKKHNLTNKETEEIFCNKYLKTFKDVKHSQKENRFVALGVTDKKRMLYVVFTIRDQKIRIISARDVSKKERRFYEKTKTN